MDASIVLTVVGVASPVLILLGQLIYRVGRTHANHEVRITRSEDDIGVIFRKVDDIHRYVKRNGG